MICSCRIIRNKDYTVGTHILFSFLNLALCFLFIWTLNLSFKYFSCPCHPQARYTKHPPSYLTRHFRSYEAALLSANENSDGRVIANQRRGLIMRTWVKWHMRHEHRARAHNTLWILLMNDEHNMGQYSSLLTTPTWWMSLELLTTCRALHVTHGAINVCLSWLNKIRVINIPTRVLKNILFTLYIFINRTNKLKCRKNPQRVLTWQKPRHFGTFWRNFNGL